MSQQLALQLVFTVVVSVKATSHSRVSEAQATVIEIKLTLTLCSISDAVQINRTRRRVRRSKRKDRVLLEKLALTLAMKLSLKCASLPPELLRWYKMGQYAWNSCLALQLQVRACLPREINEAMYVSKLHTYTHFGSR